MAWIDCDRKRPNHGDNVIIQFVDAEQRSMTRIEHGTYEHSAWFVNGDLIPISWVTHWQYPLKRPDSCLHESDNK